MSWISLVCGCPYHSIFVQYFIENTCNKLTLKALNKATLMKLVPDNGVHEKHTLAVLHSKKSLFLSSVDQPQLHIYKYSFGTPF